MNRKQDYDSYEIEEPSDEERASSSSEDELDILLNGTPEQKKKLLREYLTGESESSSCDEFEKEMEAELTTTMNSLEGNWAAPLGQAGVSTGTSGGSNPSGTQPQQVYDSIYFDSDDSDSDQEGKAGSSKSQRKKKHVIPTNDELLYDPDEDDRDQAWADAKRRRYSRCQATAGRHGMRSQTLPSSDAVLNCPSCMTTLCLDCQRHDKYRTQYRAMFVMNCEVNKEEILRYKVPQRKQKKPKQTRKKRRHDQMDAQPEAAQPEAAEPGTTDSRLGGMDEGEIYHPVLCTECSTEVAVYDKDEVYHFFNILASHS